jgi:hypothetical protein
VWVDNVKGNDAADGRTAATALRSLKRAVSALRPGDTLRLVKNAEPYREPLEISTSGTPARPVVIDGQGSVVTGLDAVASDRFVPHEPGIIKGVMSEFHRGQPRAVVNGVPMGSEGRVSELHEGQHTWLRESVYIALPEGTKWPGAEIAFMTRDRGVVIDGASHVVVRNLTVEQVSGDAFAVKGEAKSVRLENVEGRRASGGASRGLFVQGKAEAMAVRSRFHSNSSGVAAIHRTKTVLDRCEIRNNRDFGARVNGVEHAFMHCAFADNGAFDLEAIELSPESANGGGPCRARIDNALFGGKSRVGLAMQGASVELRDSVFLKTGLTAVRHREGKGFQAETNLYSGGLEVDSEPVKPEEWALRWQDGSKHVESPPAAGPWKLGPRVIGPRP